MLGAIAGDIIGSVYEFAPIKRKDFQPLFAENAFFTDDSVLTVAVADALLHGRDPVEALKDWGRRYPDAGYGGYFHEWLFSDETAPYGSFGNGAAMRVSPAGLLAHSLEQCLEMAQRVTAVTHNHPEGLKGAAATAAAVFLFRQGAGAPAVRETIAELCGYDLERSVEAIRATYTFDETCQGTVPEALVCALEASDYEDAVRNAISLGGDADTLGAITGAVAEARFGLPEAIAAQAWARLPEDMRGVLRALYQRAGTPAPWAGADDGTP